MDEAQAKWILGITDSDNARTAKIKFRRLIGKYHPDAAGDDTADLQEQAQQINAADPQGKHLGYLSFAEDELYYCLFPLMRAHLVQTKMTVVRVQRNKGNYLRQAKAEIAFRIRLKEEADRYQNPDGNMEIQQILDEYERELAVQRR